MKIHVKTYGCTANRADSHTLTKMLIELEHTLCDEENADVVVVNTCTVTDHTERKVLSTIRQLQHSGKEVIVAGCLPAAQPEHMKKLKINRILTPKKLESISQLLPTHTNTTPARNPVLTGTAGTDTIFNPIGAVSIATGCVGNCSYCIVKKARGNLTSKDPSRIKQEVIELVKKGVVEIQLTAQDTACYGWDTGHNLPKLLKELANIPGDFRIRVGMMNPATTIKILDELLEAYNSEKVYKFLHLPVQSGSDKILNDMNRNHTTADYKHIISAFSRKYPAGMISTDFIIGYPTETEDDFRQTLELLKDTKSLKVNITRYSPRPHTQSFNLKDMPDWIKKERSRKLTKKHHKISQQSLQQYIGETCTATVTEKGKNNTSITRDSNYRHIVIRERLPPGSKHTIRITGAAKTYLIGERV